ncbi:MAG: YIP1 family protein [Kurthia sp.]|nr:YIP1 family protein [Candidatus Kurthia equi]
MRKERNGLLSMVLEPRATIQSTIKQSTIGYILLLSFLATWATNLLTSFQTYRYELIEDSFEYQTVFKELITSALYSLGEVIFFLGVYAFIIWVIGKLFKGRGKFLELYKGALLSMIPFIILLPILAIWLVVSSDSFYGMGEQSVIEIILLGIVLILTLLAVVISSVYSIVMVSEIHQISKWQAVFVLFITMIIFTVLLVIVVLIIVIIFIVIEAMK